MLPTSSGACPSRNEHLGAVGGVVDGERSAARSVARGPDAGAGLAVRFDHPVRGRAVCCPGGAAIGLPLLSTVGGVFGAKSCGRYTQTAAPPARAMISASDRSKRSVRGFGVTSCSEREISRAGTAPRVRARSRATGSCAVTGLASCTGCSPPWTGDRFAVSASSASMPPSSTPGVAPAATNAGGGGGGGGTCGGGGDDGMNSAGGAD